MNYLEKIKMLSESQSGFRKKKDSIQAATFLWKQIQANCKPNNNKLYFLDITKALDSVYHEVFLQKLYHDGVRGIFPKLAAKCLPDTFQYVRVDVKVQL